MSAPNSPHASRSGDVQAAASSSHRDERHSERRDDRERRHESDERGHSSRHRDGRERSERHRDEPDRRERSDRHRDDRQRERSDRRRDEPDRRERDRGDRRDERSSRRERSRSRSPQRSRRRSRSRSASSGSSSSSSDSEDEETRRRRRRKEKERRREKEGSSRHRESREERKERKRRKKEKRLAKAAKGAILDYGKHGIISESDVTSRLTAEFRQWLVEERHINPETIPKQVERKEMSRFIEDYNTATLPLDKYYDLEAHERRMAMIRAGETLPVEGAYDPAADEAAATAAFRARRRDAESKLAGNEAWQSREQLEELRRIQAERIEVGKMKQLGMQTSSKMGVRMDSKFQ